MIEVKQISTENFVKKLFEEWAKENDIANEKIACIVESVKEVHHTTYDGWKTSPPKYIEKEFEKEIDMEDLEDYLTEMWYEEIGEDGLLEMGNDIEHIKEESFYVFSNRYNHYLKTESETYREKITDTSEEWFR